MTARRRAALAAGLCLALAGWLAPARAAETGLDEDLDALERFLDVPARHWAAPGVARLRARGLLEGWGERFHGQRPFTRYEMSQVLDRFMTRYDEARTEVDAQLETLWGRVDDHDVRLTRVETSFSRLERQLRAGMLPPRGSPGAADPPEAGDPAGSRSPDRMRALLRKLIHRLETEP